MRRAAAETSVASAPERPVQNGRTNDMTATKAWRWIGATGIALGLASFVATTILQWVLQADSPTPGDAVASHPVVWTAASLLAVLGPLVWSAGVAAVTLQVRERGWVLTTIGGILTGLGLVAGVGHLALYFGLFSDLAAGGADSATVRAVSAADDSSAVSTVLLVLFLVGFSLGPIVQTAGLRRARLLPVWVPVAALVAAVANFVGGPVAGIVQLIALLATFVPMTVLLLRREP
jgi:hypothetical protein